MNTIWGKADTVTDIADGIISVSTPSHGGYILSNERMLEMPAQLRQCSFTNDNNFEEDCSWCAVVLAWPQYFDIEKRKHAAEMYNMCYRARFGELQQ